VNVGDLLSQKLIDEIADPRRAARPVLGATHLARQRFLNAEGDKRAYQFDGLPVVFLRIFLPLSLDFRTNFLNRLSVC